MKNAFFGVFEMNPSWIGAPRPGRATKRHGAFEVQVPCAPRGAGVLLNISAKCWRIFDPRQAAAASQRNGQAGHGVGSNDSHAVRRQRGPARGPARFGGRAVLCLRDDVLWSLPRPSKTDVASVCQRRNTFVSSSVLGPRRRALARARDEPAPPRDLGLLRREPPGERREVERLRPSEGVGSQRRPARLDPRRRRRRRRSAVKRRRRRRAAPAFTGG